MKLQQITTISKKNVQACPTFTVCAYNGRIAFNAPTCQMLGLAMGDAVAFYRDTDAVGHPWYIAKEKKPGALLLRLNLGTAIYGVDAPLTRQLLESFGESFGSIRFRLADNPVDGAYWRVEGKDA